MLPNSIEMLLGRPSLRFLQMVPPDCTQGLRELKIEFNLNVALFDEGVDGFCSNLVGMFLRSFSIILYQSVPLDCT